VPTDKAGRSATPEELAAAVETLKTPDTLESPFGTLRFFDGVPLPETVETAYDALDLMRGVEAFLNCMPGASLVAMRRGFRSAGITGRAIGYTDPRANSGSLLLTANTETTYGTTFIDLRAWGPTVIEPPPMGLCVVDDFWFRYVADMGIAGPDRGEGGKYLFLPPGYEGDAPEGYFTYRCPTFGQLGDPAGARRCPRNQRHEDLPPRSGRQAGRERVPQHRRAGVQHHPR